MIVVAAAAAAAIVALVVVLPLGRWARLRFPLRRWAATDFARLLTLYRRGTTLDRSLARFRLAQLASRRLFAHLRLFTHFPRLLANLAAIVVATLERIALVLDLARATDLVAAALRPSFGRRARLQRLHRRTFYLIAYARRVELLTTAVVLFTPAHALHALRLLTLGRLRLDGLRGTRRVAQGNPVFRRDVSLRRLGAFDLLGCNPRGAEISAAALRVVARERRRRRWERTVPRDLQ